MSICLSLCMSVYECGCVGSSGAGVIDGWVTWCGFWKPNSSSESFLQPRISFIYSLTTWCMYSVYLDHTYFQIPFHLSSSAPKHHYPIFTFIDTYYFVYFFFFWMTRWVQLMLPAGKLRILSWSCSGNHNCSEFMSAMPISRQEDGISQTPAPRFFLPPPTWHFLYLVYVYGVCFRCPI